MTDPEDTALGPETPFQPNRRPLVLSLYDAVPDYRRHTMCRVHVMLTKVTVLLTMPFYLAVLAFVFHHGNATTFMFALIILGSVSAFTLYGAFKGSKMCLIPYIFMQLVFLVYVFILVVICLIGAFRDDLEMAFFITGQAIFYQMDARMALLLLALILTLLSAPLVLSTHIIYRDFCFISELDEILSMYQEAQQRASADKTPDFP